MNHGATGLAEKLLHPVARSPVMLPGVEDDDVWVPPIFFSPEHNYWIPDQQEQKETQVKAEAINLY